MPARFGLRHLRLLLVPAVPALVLYACGGEDAIAPQAYLDDDSDSGLDCGENGCCDEETPCDAPDVCLDGVCQTVTCTGNSDCPQGFVCSSKSHLCLAATMDGGKPDAGKPDAGKADAGRPDAGRPDAGRPDAGRPDAGRPDAGRPDAGRPDAGRFDAGPVDAGRPDGGRPDAGAPDAGRPDGGRPDAGTPDGGPRDGGSCNGSCAQTCGNGTVCNTNTCQCVNPNSTCTAARDCLSGYACVPIPQVGMNYCLKLCSSTQSCPSGQPCCAVPGGVGSFCSPIGQCL